MNTFVSKLMPLAVASVICGIALAGGGKDDPMKLMDADGDGKVTAAEHANGARLMFSKMDTNHDRRVTATEMAAAQPMVKGYEDPMASAEDGPDKKAAEKNYGQDGMLSASQKIAALDTNDDGALTAEEHAAGSKKIFTQLDTNRDGALPAQEMRDGHRSMTSASDQ